MADYWCRFFDSRGAVVSAVKLSAADDAEAVATARRLSADCRAHDFDLHCGKRLVLRERLATPTGRA
ncbi:MAG TPA: hypothetical protein VJR47_08400 [Stellaceae bacterium]|nr:hypothetical protein [Stellaceae bacterium]